MNQLKASCLQVKTLKIYFNIDVNVNEEFIVNKILVILRKQ